MRIIYKRLDEKISVITPTPEALSFATIKQIAEKDVPKDFPYWIVANSYIPADRTYRETWRIDPALGDPAGFGGESNEFNASLGV